MASQHTHPIEPERVAVARPRGVSPAAPERAAPTLRLLADPVHARLVSALREADELCVGDIALALDVSDSSISHALRLLRTAGVVRNRRAGRVIYYRLTDAALAAALDAVSATPNAGRRHDDA